MAIGKTNYKRFRTWELKDNPYANLSDSIGGVANATSWSLNKQWQEIENILYNRFFQDKVKAIQNDPPAEPLATNRYIVLVGTGDWENHDGQIAEATTDETVKWVFITPVEGMKCYLESENCFYYYTGTNWVSEFDKQVSGEVLTDTGDHKTFTSGYNFIVGHKAVFIGNARTFDYTETLPDTIILDGPLENPDIKVRMDYLRSDI